MKHIYFYAILLFYGTNCIAQTEEEYKFRSFFDVGYFGSSFKPASGGGNYLSAGFGYKINKEFWLNLTIVKISSSGEFEQRPFFISNETNYSNTMIIPNFSKDWKISKKLYVCGSLGAALIFENVLIPSLQTGSSNNIVGVNFNNEGRAFDIGLYGEFTIKYELLKNLLFTVNTRSYIPLYLEPESLMVGAGFEIKL